MMASVALVAVEESVAVMAVFDSELYLRLAGKKILVSAELIEASGTIVSVWRLGSKVALVNSGRSTKVCSKCRHIRIRLRERRRG